MALQHIPPIQCLLAFEALARLRHAGRAADELCVTPSAVSHRIRQLESHLGIKLFGRSDFTLTADGVAYLANVRPGLVAFQKMPPKSVDRGMTRLRVAVTPTVCRQFVMPRLELFRNAYPDIELILQVSIPLLDVTAEEADLEIRFGTGGYTDPSGRSPRAASSAARWSRGAPGSPPAGSRCRSPLPAHSSTTSASSTTPRPAVSV